MIDINLPLELEDGTPVTYIRDHIARPENKPTHLVKIDGVIGNKMYWPDGRHYYKQHKNLRNKIMKVVDVNKPVTVGGKEAKIVHQFDNGNLAVVVDGWSEVQNYNKYGQSNGEGCVVLVNAVQITERWVNVYPLLNQVYLHSSPIDAEKSYQNATGKVGAFRVKQTLHDGVVVNTEVVV